MQKLQLQMPLHLGHCQSSNNATSSAFSPYLKHHQPKCIEKKLRCKNLLNCLTKFVTRELRHQANLFNRHLWQNLRVHSLFPFWIAQAAAKSIVFWRHFDDFKQTRTKKDINHKENRHGKKINEPVNCTTTSNLEIITLPNHFLDSLSCETTKLMQLTKTSALNIIKKRSRIPLSFYLPTFYHQPTES